MPAQNTPSERTLKLSELGSTKPTTQTSDDTEDGPGHKPSSWEEVLSYLWPEVYAEVTFALIVPNHPKFARGEVKEIRSAPIHKDLEHTMRVREIRSALLHVGHILCKEKDDKHNIVLMNRSIVWLDDHFYCEVFCK